MNAVFYSSALRFHRERVWLAALAVPALWAALSAAGVFSPVEGPPGVRLAAVAFGLAHHVLPFLAALFVLSPSQGSDLDLLLSRPLRWQGLLLRRAAAGCVLFGACQLVLLGGATAALTVLDGVPAGRVWMAPVERRALLPNGPCDGAELSAGWPSKRTPPVWFERVGEARVWSFRFTGLDPSGSSRGQAWPLLGHFIWSPVEESHAHAAASTPAPIVREHRELARGETAAARLWFGSLSGDPHATGEALTLRESGPVEFEIPSGAIGRDGVLDVGIAMDASALQVGNVGPVRWGAPFFWIDPSGMSLRGGGNPLETRDVRVEVGAISAPTNALRAMLDGFPRLLVVVAIAATAAILFSPAVAFAVTLTMLVLGSSLPFLREVVEILERENALVLLSHAGEHAHDAHPPSAFESGLQDYLGFWLNVIPDLSRFRGRRFLFLGEAMPWRAVLFDWLYGLVVAGASMVVALPFLWRKEVKR